MNETRPNSLVVYAYGVEPLYGSPNGLAFDEIGGIICRWSPYAYLHYWVDDKLVHHVEQKESYETPELNFIIGSKFSVDLKSPYEYSVKIK